MSHPARLRPEIPDDGAFLRALFAAEAAPPLRRAGLPDEEVEHLVGLQLRSRDASYRAVYPEARFGVVEWSGVPVGRLVEADTGDLTRVVDIAVDPARRRRGIAAAVLRNAMARWAGTGRGACADVAVSNGASLALFTRLGFAGRPRPGDAQVTLTWRPRRPHAGDRRGETPD